MSGKKGIFLKAFFVLLLVIGISNVNAQLAKQQTKKQSGFTENKGQIYDQNNAPNPSVKYLATIGNGLNVQLKSSGFSYDSYSVQTKLKEYVHPTDKSLSKTVDELVYQYHRIDVELVGANANAQIIATNPNEGFENYYTPNTSEKGLLSILSYKKVTYIDIYPDIDLEFVISENIEKPIEYNFIVHPGGDLSQIKLKYIGCDGLDLINNKLQIKTKLGVLSETIPSSWIKETGTQRSVTYRMIEQQGTNFVIGLAIDVNKQNNETLIIDPIPSIEWGSYYGGSNEEAVLGLSVNLVNDDFYATGFSNSTSNIATSGSVHQIALAGSYDAFLVKFDKDGTRLWATYFGGTNEDAGFKVAYDYFGGVSVAGRTKSTSGIASVGAHDQTFVSDDWTRFKAAFLARFNNVDGTRYWATYYGSTDQFIDLRIDEGGPGLAVSPSGIYFASASWEDNSIVAGATPMQNTFAGMEDMTIAKFGYNGAIIWGTYYGGAADRETATSIALDASENVYVTGFAKSQGLQTAGASQPLNNGGQDAYVLKMNSAGQKQWFTYYGGTDNESSYGVACDMSNNVYLVGNTYSETNISTVGSHQATKPLNNTIQSGFIAKFTSAGSRTWGTYWGGVSGDGDRINVTTACGLGILVAMIARSSGLASPNASQSAINGNQDVLFARFDTAGVREWATYYGGFESTSATNRMFPYDMKVNSKNNILICGETASASGIATPNGFDTSYAAGVRDGFITRFSEVAIMGLKTVCEGSTLSLVCEFATSSTTASYSWSGPGGITSTNDTLIVPNIPLTAAGLYTVTVSVNGCSYIKSDSIKVNPVPTPMANVASPICVNDSVKLTSSGGVSYSWSGPNGFVSSAQNPNIVTSVMASAGIYVVTVTNSLGCTATAQDTLVVNARPAATASSNSPICEYQSINLSSSPNSQTSYSWSGPLSYVSTLQNPTITNAAINKGGNYSVTITNSFGCTATAQTTVVVNPNPIAGASSNSPVCEKGTINLTSTPNSQTSYVWSGPQSYSATVQNPSITNAATNMSGNYSVIIANSFGCKDTAQVTVIVNANPLVTASSNSPICENDTLKLFSGPNSQTSYAWSGPLSYSNSIQNPIISNAGITRTGNYIVTVTNSNGCSAIEQTSVVVNPVPVITASSNSPVCEGDTLKLFSTGGGSYSWSGIGGFTSITQNPTRPNSIPTMSGLYTVIVTNGFGCKSTLQVNALVNPKPIAQISSSPAICSGYTLNLYSDGGSSYAWTGPNSFTSNLQNPIIDPVAYADSGLYTVIVTNTFTCKDTASLNVVVHDNPIPTISSNSPLCAYDSIQLNAGGGVSYSWSGVASYLSTVQNPIIHTTDSTLSGVYAVVVTNQYGCTTSTSTTVEVKSNPKPMLTSNAPICAGDTLRLFSSSGQSYLWHGPNGFSNINQNLVLPSALVSQNGYYKQIISYANGCSNDDSLLIVIHANPVISTNPDTTICLYQMIDVAANGAVSYFWNNGIASPTFSIYPSADTTYLVIGVDVHGCRDTASFDVNVLPFVEVSLDQNPAGTLFKDQLASYIATPAGYNNYSFYVNNNLVQNSSSNTLTTANIQNGDLVTVLVTHANTCFSNPELGVKVIEIYNSFSPNDDGVNDLFLKGYQITVFNRWGDVMYQGVDGWNGKFNGEDVNTGTYYFTITYYTADNQKIEYKGDLMLVR